MRKQQRDILLAVSAVIVAVIFLVSIFVILPTSGSDNPKKAFSIHDLSVVNQTDHLQISFGVANETNQWVIGNGTAKISIVDNSSKVIYTGNLGFNEADFKNVATPNGTEPEVSLGIPYTHMNHSDARGGSLTCTLSLSSREWATNQTRSTIDLPYVLTLIRLNFEPAMPMDQENMMIGGKIDGGVSYEPFVSDLVEKGYAKVLVRDSDIWPDHPSYVLVLDKTWATNNPELAARVVRAHIDAEQWIQNALADPNSENYAHLVNEAMQISNKSKATVVEALKQISFSYNLNDTTRSYVKLYADGYMDEGLISNQSLANWSYQNTQQFANSYVDSNYINSAMGVSPSSSIVGNVSIGYVKGNIFMLPTYIALDTSLWGGKTAFEKYGVEANLPEPSGYNTSALVTRAVITGETQAGFTGICPTILMHFNNSLNGVIVAQMTANGTALVVKKNINSLNDLDGKTIATVDRMTIQYIFLVDLAKKYGILLTPVS